MPKEINFYQEMASEHRLQEFAKVWFPFAIHYVQVLT